MKVGMIVVDRRVALGALDGPVALEEGEHLGRGRGVGWNRAAPELRIVGIGVLPEREAELERGHLECLICAEDGEASLDQRHDIVALLQQAALKCSDGVAAGGATRTTDLLEEWRIGWIGSAGADRCD